MTKLNTCTDTGLYDWACRCARCSEIKAKEIVAAMFPDGGGAYDIDTSKATRTITKRITVSQAEPKGE